jgi:hypothetical protein
MRVPKMPHAYAGCGKGRPTLRRSGPAVAALSVAACAPTVDIGGVYVPAWLFSAVTGLVTAYAVVWLMAKRPAWRTVARSGVLYCSLALSLAMLTWWLLFSRFG